MVKRRRDPLVDRAYRVVRDLERDTYAMIRATMPVPWKYARAVVDLDEVAVDERDFNEVLKRRVPELDYGLLAALGGGSTTTYGEDLIQLARWQRHGVIYGVDPTVLDALLDTDWEATAIPGEVLTRLPHPDPIVVLPEPLRWPNDEGLWETYTAFGVFGVRPPRRRASSAAADLSHIALHYFGRVTDEVGVPVQVAMPDLSVGDGSIRVVRQVVGCRVVVDVRSDATMPQRQEAAMRDMLAGGPAALTGFADLEAARAGMDLLTRTGLAVLTYLASDNRDVTRRGTAGGGLARGRRRSASEPETPATVYGVGYRVGAALSAERRAGGPPSKPGPATGRTVAPHVRRAHLHTFRRGPGRAERFVKWLPPTVVNSDGARRARPQVHRVD